MMMTMFQMRAALLMVMLALVPGEMLDPTPRGDGFDPTMTRIRNEP